MKTVVYPDEVISPHVIAATTLTKLAWPFGPSPGEAAYQRALASMSPEARTALAQNPQRIAELEQSVQGAVAADPRLASAVPEGTVALPKGPQTPQQRLAGARNYVNQLMASGKKDLAVQFMRGLQQDPTMASVMPVQRAPAAPQQPWQIQEAQKLVNAMPGFAPPAAAQPAPRQAPVAPPRRAPVAQAPRVIGRGVSGVLPGGQRVVEPTRAPLPAAPRLTSGGVHAPNLSLKPSTGIGAGAGAPRTSLAMR